MKLEAFDKVPAFPLEDIAGQNVAELEGMGLRNFGDAQVGGALDLLAKYKAGKQVLETRLKEENLWWRRRHFEAFGNDKKRIPAGAQLFNSLENKIADIYDNLPECAFLARSQDDEKTAALLTDVMPAILENANVENAFVAVTREKVVCGTGIYSVTWDQHKRGGLGDLSIKSVSPLNLYWEPGITDIQDSPHLFYVYNVENETLKAEFPELDGKLGGKSHVVTEYVYEDMPDDSRRTPVIDYYYKRRSGNRTVLHFAKICEGVLLYASENDKDYAERGWYDHGKYPFVFDTLFPLYGSPCGFGYVTVGKDQQYQIDCLNNAVTRNAIIASTRRKYVRKDAKVNIEDLMDISKEVIEVGGSGDVRETVMSIEEPALSGNYIAILQNLENTLKEVTANRDFSQGGTSGGVTSGTAIATLVEAGSKQVRMILRGSYNAYQEVCTISFELERQFDIHDRTFRITGTDGTTQYKTFSNAPLQAVPQVVEGEDMGSKEPVFDIKIRPHKKSPFARITQNAMMQEFYGMHFFDPANSTQALACLEGMEFDGKDAVCRMIEKNGTVHTENIQLKQAMLRLAAIIDMEKGTNLTAEMAQSFGVETPQAAPGGVPQSAVEESPDIMQTQTDPRQKKAAAKVAESTEV